jgi:hypothetical protein
MPLWQVQQLAEAAGLEAVYRVSPATGVPWASRCHSARLKPVRGLLGRPAVWTYECRGEAHTGWLFAGSWWTWRVVLDAATGDVLAAEARRQ